MCCFDRLIVIRELPERQGERRSVQFNSDPLALHFTQSSRTYFFIGQTDRKKVVQRLFASAFFGLADVLRTG